MSNSVEKDAHLSPMACSRCNPLECACPCHKECLCIPDDATTARDPDTGNPQEYVRVPGFWGWLRSGWRDVACPVHTRVIPPATDRGASDV